MRKGERGLGSFLTLASQKPPKEVAGEQTLLSPLGGFCEWLWVYILEFYNYYVAATIPFKRFYYSAFWNIKYQPEL